MAMIKKATFFIGLITCLFLCAPIFAEGFYIENYDVDLQVNKYKQIHVTEHIDVFFSQASHGIYRDIPYNNAEITNLYVSERYSVLNRNNKINIKIFGVITEDSRRPVFLEKRRVTISKKFSVICDRFSSVL